MSKNDLKNNKHQKMQKKKKWKIKISYSDSLVNETHLWPEEHCLKIYKKKKCKIYQLPSLIYRMGLNKQCSFEKLFKKNYATYRNYINFILFSTPCRFTYQILKIWWPLAAIHWWRQFLKFSVTFWYISTGIVSISSLIYSLSSSKV
jgi:hypothetical protein